MLILGSPWTDLVILYVVGKVFSRRIQRRWNREKRFRIVGDIPEFSFTNLSLRGEWSLDLCLSLPGTCVATSSHLGSHLKILERGERRFLLEYSSEVQRRLDHYKAGSCFPHISSSILRILVKLGIYGKLFSRGIQRHRLRGIWRRTRERRRILPENDSMV